MNYQTTQNAKKDGRRYMTIFTIFFVFFGNEKVFLGLIYVERSRKNELFLPQYLGICCFFKVDDEVTGIWSLQGKIIAVW